MCGIWAYLNLVGSIDEQNLWRNFMNIKHRGPDTTTYRKINNLYFGFHRLAIIDTSLRSEQPCVIDDGERAVIFMCNGEIYNYKELNEAHNLPLKHESDCMTLLKLYIKTAKEVDGYYDLTDFVKLLEKEIKGEFAFSIFELDKFKKVKQIIVGRDQIGVRPLYFSRDNEKIIITSEVKGALELGGEIREFEPGIVSSVKINLFNTQILEDYSFSSVYKTIQRLDLKEFEFLATILRSVVESVRRRLISDRPIAFLLSGGVDSSLVAAISSKILGQQIKTFCCGMEGGTDLLYARKVADHIGSKHTEVIFTAQQGLDVIKDVIKTVETWDTTTIRASVGQYLVCKYIAENTDAKVVMVGEGPDEVCSSYLFNYYAPNGIALDEASREYVLKIHMYDGRRADRCISRWGLEGRIAFLDPEFIKEYWSIPSDFRHPMYKGIEKWWLRAAFNNTGILPTSVLWRKKEAFSDGVSGKEKSWFQTIQEHIQMELQNDKGEKIPTPEAYYYKKIFTEIFGEHRINILPSYWQPKWDASGKVVDYVDPSARTLKVYQ